MKTEMNEEIRKSRLDIEYQIDFISIIIKKKQN